MICIGYNNIEKDTTIIEYCKKNNIKKIFVLSPIMFYFEITFTNYENISYENIIEYKPFYRLLQEINNTTLIIINECLRTRNRNDLTYNCIRHYLNQTTHQIIFQYIPIIQEFKDFYILFDFDTRSRWKRKEDIRLLKHCNIKYNKIAFKLEKNEVETTKKDKEGYRKKRNILFNTLGTKDPHTIPRNLHLYSGKFKLLYINKCNNYITRNKRYKLNNFYTYKEFIKKDIYDIFEFCHNFRDFSDFLCLSKQTKFNVLSTDLKVDEWYFDRFSLWIERIYNAYTKI